MNARRIRIKKNSVRENDSSFIVDSKLNIPKSFVIKADEQLFYSSRNPNSKQTMWMSLYLDPDFFKQTKVITLLRLLKDNKKIFIYDRKSYGIIWDNVTDRMYTRHLNVCFFCDEELIEKVNRTRDHLIPSVMLNAYGLRFIDDNIVPSCKDCNSDKASLHPYTWREKVRNKVRILKLKKWITVQQVLDEILIEKKDVFR